MLKQLEKERKLIIWIMKGMIRKLNKQYKLKTHYRSFNRRFMWKRSLIFDSSLSGKHWPRIKVLIKDYFLTRKCEQLKEGNKVYNKYLLRKSFNATCEKKNLMNKFGELFPFSFRECKNGFKKLYEVSKRTLWTKYIRSGFFCSFYPIRQKLNTLIIQQSIHITIVFIQHWSIVANQKEKTLINNQWVCGH